MLRRTLLGALAATAAAGAAHASQEWPQRNVRLLVGFTPGGFVDIVARAMAEQFTTGFGQTFVVENRSGAAGTIAADATSKAAPDGYTLLMGHSSPNAVAAALYANLPYDPVRDLTPIIQIASHPHMLSVPATSPFHSTADLVAAAKAAPGKLTYASAGIGALHHIAAEMFARAAGIELTHVPYRGSTPAIADVIAGRIDMIIEGVGSVGPYIDAGKLRPLAAGTLKRIPRFPDMPTLQEQGYGDLDAMSWVGLFGPAGLPSDITEKIAAATMKALAVPSVAQMLSNSSMLVTTRQGRDFADFLVLEVARYKSVLGNSQINL